MTGRIRLFDGSGLKAELARRVMIANARFACGEAGRNYGDPVFEQVTEGRQKYAGYSSCGDLAHWCLERVGLRDERILNRSDDDGVVPWRVGVNVSRLVFATGNAFKWWRAGDPVLAQPGDIGLIGENGGEHVFVVEAIDGQTLRSFDYGQFFNGKPGGTRCTRTLVPGTRYSVVKSQLPGKPWIGSLDLVELLAPYALRGELADAEVPDGFDGALAAQPAEPQPSPGPLRPLVTTRQIQQALTELGYDPGPVDGLWGSRTKAAVIQFQLDHGLLGDGVVGKRTRAAMQAKLG